MSWQQQQHPFQPQRLPRIVAESGGSQAEGEREATTATLTSSSRQMGPPSQSLPSLNTFRQLAPLRSPNLPSSLHSSNYFTQQRHRSTSESVANEGLRALRNQQQHLHHHHHPPPVLPEPPSTILSSTKRGEVLPPLAAFGRPTSPNITMHGETSNRSPVKGQMSHHFHPYHHHQQQQQHQHQQPLSSSSSSSTSSSSFQSMPQYPSGLYRSPPSNYTNKSPTSPRGYYPDMSPHQITSSSSSAQQDRHYHSPGGSSSNYDRSMEGSREGSLLEGEESNSRKLAKSHVPSACLNCKRAHLACDVSRPCRRCINLGKTDTCIDVQHKKRGRPRLRDREAAAVAAAAAATITHSHSIKPEHQSAFSSSSSSSSSGLPGHHRMRGSFSSSSSASTMKQSPRSEPATFLSPIGGDSINLFSPTSGKPSTSISSINSSSRGRSVSSSASLWSQQNSARVGAITSSNSSSGDFSSSSSAEAPPTVSLILSTGLQCARCSVESHALLGFSPSDLLERSLFELVQPSEKPRLEQLWLSLIEPVGVKPQVVPANAETVMNLSPSLLMAPAPGTVFMQETMRLRQRSGIFDFYSIRLHLGGGFGADLYQQHTLDRAYIVASLLKLGNDATHPDPNFLREARWDSGGDSRHFSTPQTRQAPGAGVGVGGGGGNGDVIGIPGISGGMSGNGGGIAPPYYGGVQSNSGSMMLPYHTSISSSSAPSRCEWQQRPKSSSNDKPVIPPSTSSSYSRPSHQREEYHHSNGHNVNGINLRDSRPRSAHEMDITPPATATVKSRNIDIAPAPLPPASSTSSSSAIKSSSSNRPSLAQNNGNTIAPSGFSYSSRAEIGGIAC